MKWITKYILLLVVLLDLGFGQSNKTEVKVQVSATVVDYLEMIILADIDVGTVIPSNDLLRLDPRTDQGVGLIKIEGRMNSSIQVSYSAQVEMVNLATNTTMTVTYGVSGNDSNEQLTSDIFTTSQESVVLSSNGEYYLWIGCSFSLVDLVPGEYDGDFIIEVDYN